METLPVTENQVKASACVVGVAISDTMTRTVLGTLVSSTSRPSGPHGTECLHQASGEDARAAPNQDHLPDIAGQAKEGRRDGEASEGDDQDRFASPFIARVCPDEEHKYELGARKDGLDETGVEADAALLDTCVLDHLGNVGEDGEEAPVARSSNQQASTSTPSAHPQDAPSLDHPSVAQDGQLLPWQARRRRKRWRRSIVVVHSKQSRPLTVMRHCSRQHDWREAS